MIFADLGNQVGAFQHGHDRIVDAAQGDIYSGAPGPVD